MSKIKKEGITCCTINSGMDDFVAKPYILAFHDEGRYHIETSPLICVANQWTGFYIITASIMKGLKNIGIALDRVICLFMFSHKWVHAEKTLSDFFLTGYILVNKALSNERLFLYKTSK